MRRLFFRFLRMMMKFDLFRKKLTNYNQIDGKVDRRSFMGTYEIDPVSNRPKNPSGRTGCTISV